MNGLSASVFKVFLMYRYLKEQNTSLSFPVATVRRAPNLAHVHYFACHKHELFAINSFSQPKPLSNSCRGCGNVASDALLWAGGENEGKHCDEGNCVSMLVAFSTARSSQPTLTSHVWTKQNDFWQPAFFQKTYDSSASHSFPTTDAGISLPFPHLLVHLYTPAW